MAQSFVLEPGHLGRPTAGRRRVLVTGAAGRIGRAFADRCRGRFDLRLMVRPADEGVESLGPMGEVVTAELSDTVAVRQHCDGVDVVVHLAGDPDPNAVWADLLENNIVGTYNLMVAAKAAGVRRVVYASSIHAVSGYPRDYQVHTTDPVNPGDLYGVSKCFAEALGRYMAEQEGLGVICVRIGGFQPPSAMAAEGGVKMADAWVSHDDLCDLLARCVEADHLRFAVFHGLSDNVFKRLDITGARELLGYAPEDDIGRTNAALRDAGLSDLTTTHALPDGERSGLREDLRP